jgi:hypothetical protein
MKEKRLLRRIFGSKMDDVVGIWKNSHNGEIHNSNSSPNVIKIIKSDRIRQAGHVARMEEKRNSYMILSGKLEGKKRLGRPKHVSVDSIKMDVGEIRLVRMEWIYLAQDKGQWKTLVKTVMNPQVP